MNSTSITRHCPIYFIKKTNFSKYLSRRGIERSGSNDDHMIAELIFPNISTTKNFNFTSKRQLILFANKLSPLSFPILQFNPLHALKLILHKIYNLSFI